MLPMMHPSVLHAKWLSPFLSSKKRMVAEANVQQYVIQLLGLLQPRRGDGATCCSRGMGHKRRCQYTAERKVLAAIFLNRCQSSYPQ